MIADFKSQPFIIILFGATGDLTSRKIIPALYNLFLDDWLPEQFVIIGSSIDKVSEEDFRKKLFDAVNQFSRKGKAEEKKWAEFSSRIFYQVADFNNSDSFKEFGVNIQHYQDEWKKEVQVIYYMAVAPNYFSVIAENISKNKLVTIVQLI